MEFVQSQSAVPEVKGPVGSTLVRGSLHSTFPTGVQALGSGSMSTGPGTFLGRQTRHGPVLPEPQVWRGNRCSVDLTVDVTASAYTLWAVL